MALPPRGADAPSISLANLLVGDWGAAGRALVAPESLSPAEARRTTAEILFRSKLDKGFFGHLFATITDPFVLIGAALSLGFPLPVARGLQQVSKKLSRAIRQPGTTRYLKGPWNLFRDMKKEVYDPLMSVVDNKGAFRQRHEADFRKAFDTFRSAKGRDPTTQELYLVSWILDDLHLERPAHLRFFKRPVPGRVDPGQLRSPFKPGALEQEAAGPVRELAERLRPVMEHVFDDIILSDPDLAREVALAMQKRGLRMSPTKIQQRLEARELRIPDEVRELLRRSRRTKSLQKKIIEQLQAPDARLVEVVKKIKTGYLPHQLPKDMKAFEEWARKLYQGVPERRAGKIVSATIDARTADALHPRYGRMLPDPTELERVAPHLLDPERVSELKSVMVGYRRTKGGLVAQELDDLGYVAHPGVPYSTNFHDVMSKYMSQMSAVYAFNRGGSGRKLRAAIDHLKDTGQAWRAHALEDTLLPEVAGRVDFQRALRMNEWAAKRTEWLERLNSETGRKIFGQGPLKEMGDWLKKGLADPSGPWGSVGVNGPLANLLYLGAMGANVSPVFLNSLQTILTTAPLIGMRHAIEGMGRVFTKGKKYFRMRYADGMAHEEAFRVAFKDFYESGLPSAPLFEEAIGAGMQSSFRAGAAGAARTITERVRDSLMKMFQVTEVTNRLVAFEGAVAMGRAGARGVRMGRKEATDMARWVVRETQFPSGAESSPYILTKMRGWKHGRLLTMFMQFPLRSLEFMMSTATTVGGGGREVMGRNFGTLGRMLMYGGLARHAGEAMGIDLSRGLFYDVVPEVREGKPFAPMIVPPILSIMGAAAMDLSGWEFDELRYTVPLMVPGGMAAARAASFVSPTVGKALGRKYVDYGAPGPDGRYAVYSAARETGPTLVGYATGGELIATGLGLRTTGPLGREGETMRWLMGNRDRIRGAKRQYLEAAMRNDYAEMERIEASFNKAYPELEGGLRSLVKKGDIQTILLRQKVTRLERVLETLPTKMRPAMVQAILGSALGQEGSEGFLGINPELLGTGTVKSRMPLRAG